MKCCKCSAKLLEGANNCTVCNTKYVSLCVNCGTVAEGVDKYCHKCGGELRPVWNPSVEELLKLGIHCFMPYVDDRIYDLYLGGNHDGGGYVFHNMAGYTGPSLETIILPSMVEGRIIVGIWNEFFCIGDDFAPEAYDKTFKRMYPIKNIIVSEGVQEAGIYAFFGCCGLDTLVLPKSMKKMMYDFADLFPNGTDAFPNGRTKSPVTVCYTGSEEDWSSVVVTNLFNEYVRKGLVRLKFDYEV